MTNPAAYFRYIFPSAFQYQRAAPSLPPLVEVEETPEENPLSAWVELVQNQVTEEALLKALVQIPTSNYSVSILGDRNFQAIVDSLKMLSVKHYRMLLGWMEEEIKPILDMRFIPLRDMQTIQCHLNTIAVLFEAVKGSLKGKQLLEHFIAREPYYKDTQQAFHNLTCRGLFNLRLNLDRIRRLWHSSSSF